ncbi:MAG: oxygen-independent coproporphyrinogen oxidase [Acetobacteraceae bacterium]|nr:oxygen-independent coproporphyrinogen oxidase [Acetobacteraceae bacterium]
MTSAAAQPDGTIAKYLTERIPRYTSYPTAPHFSASVGAACYGGWLRALPATARLSLYLHVPFCRSLCWYCGCHTSVTRHREPIERYMATLLREVALVADLAGSHRVAHIHWGGGTPTIVGPDIFAAVMATLRQRFTVEPGAEIAVEVDPRRLDPAMASALGRAGVTRASLGLQTFEPAVQHAVARIQSLDVTRTCVDLLRGAGIEAINVDLLYGLPHETVASCEASVEAALTLDPARFSVFGYAHVPAMMKHQRAIDAAALPDAAERLRQEQAIGHALVRAGYQRIGLDHYAHRDDTLSRACAAGTLRRNFQGYTDDPADALIGFGASSIGQSAQGYVQNVSDPKRWSERIEAGELATARGFALTPEDRLRGAIIERLMCDLRADVPATLREHGFPAEWLDLELEALRPLVADGLARVESGVVTVAEPARNLVRRVASAFDAYLDPAAGRHAVAV